MASSRKPSVKKTGSAGQIATPLAAIGRFLEQVPKTRRLLIGFSGGLDSHVLLHAVASCRAHRPDLELLAVHVDHGIQASSGEWANHCQNVCRDLDVAIEVLQTSVLVDSAEGPEASARIARYSLFASIMRDGDYVLLAQHADDQAETFLLQALRGSGPDGLASIPQKRSFANGWLCRPLLGSNRSELQHYAKKASLRWIEDPSNADTALDRNFLRHDVLPLLRERWPALNQTLARSASRAGAASRLLMSLATDDLSVVRGKSDDSLTIPVLLSLGEDRIFNVIRLWVRRAGFRMPRLQDLKQVEANLLKASAESGGIVNAREYEFRRYRDQLYLLAPQAPVEAFQYPWPAPFEDLHIPELGKTLSLAQCVDQGLDFSEHARVKVQSRMGGELIKLGNPEFHKAVKKLLQEAQVPPWRRESIPLIYVDGKLAAVWEIAVSNDYRTAAVSS